MSDLAPNLDDLRFQKDLVDEARRRIIRYCPEWTDYNLSDPGITLIELFSWMTEMLVYRLNRVPERNYLKFLEMLGVELSPASSARVELTFYLSVPFPINSDDDISAVIPKGL
jgi:predicted phage baseplate assembly protein